MGLIVLLGLSTLYYITVANPFEIQEAQNPDPPCAPQEPASGPTVAVPTIEYVQNITFVPVTEYVQNVTLVPVPQPKPERRSDAVGVAILVPTTSRVSGPYCAHCLNVMSVAMRELAETLSRTDERFWYTVYVGYDDADPMWDHEGRLRANLDTANRLFHAHPVVVKAVRIQRYPNPNKGSLTNVWNKLCEAALADGNEYVFLDNDDLIIQTPNFAPRLVEALRGNALYPGLGESAPYDTSFPDEEHPTFPMVSRVHFEIFGQMYSTEIFSRGCDTWLGDVYRGFGSVISLQEVKVSNTAYGTPRRYENDFNDWRYRDLVVEGRRKIAAFLRSKGVQGTWPEDLCGVPKTFGC